ncbi:HD domain-containing protein [Nocardia sp. XZ_19_369]|uniref:HD domain-containing protein n=1 Tax=Nocardia sp. XZ_19_369 TaxID=2769487 RepID=UPI00188F048E|nr:HD domain-containing protein [Nocardia sp. XZ_19_369]
MKIVVAQPSETRLARASTELLLSCAPPVLVNHCQRAFQFAWRLGEVRGWTVDRELLYISTMLHDLGLTKRFDGPAGFEMEGADAAARFLRERDYPEDRIRTVYDAIALHLDMEREPHEPPEVRLCASGSGVDTHALRIDEVGPEFVAAVVDAWPRLGFRNWLRQECRARAVDKPDSKIARWFDMGRMPEGMGHPTFTE